MKYDTVSGSDIRDCTFTSSPYWIPKIGRYTELYITCSCAMQR